MKLTGIDIVFGLILFFGIGLPVLRAILSNFPVVRRSAYLALDNEVDRLKRKCNALIERLEKEEIKTAQARRERDTVWSELNKYQRGHKEQQTKQVNTQFTEAEIKTLLQLCHPDKHGGKESATKITQKLLELRK